MIRDYTSEFCIPSAQKAMTEASMTEAYLAHHPNVRQSICETQRLMDDLVKTYQEVLGTEGSIKAKCLNTFIREPKDYKCSFMVNALMMCYRVFDKTHAKYPRLLELVSENDPDWLEAIKADHEAKLARCKVPIVEIN